MPGFMIRGMLAFITILRKEGLFPAHDQRKRGRTWGRDEFGKVDFDRYWSGRPIPSQNLLSEHHRRMDFLREERWYAAERERLANRAEEMEREATGKDEKKGEEAASEPADEDTEVFVPGPFLPQGIEPQSNPPGNMEDALRPLPPDPSLPLWKGMSRPRLTWKNRRPLSPL